MKLQRGRRCLATITKYSDLCQNSNMFHNAKGEDFDKGLKDKEEGSQYNPNTTERARDATAQLIDDTLP